MLEILIQVVDAREPCRQMLELLRVRLDSSVPALVAPKREKGSVIRSRVFDLVY